MQHNGWNLLSNISVRAKLTLGFSLLIGMILLVAYTGWQATDALRDRSERISDISGFSTLARDMRIERLVYIVKADDTQAAKWLAALDKIEAQLQSVTPNFNSKANEALLSEAKAALKRYRDFYNQVVTATRERAAVQQAATATAEAANTYLLALATAANAQEGRFEDRQQVAALFIDLQQMRIALRSYATTPGKENESAAHRALDEIQAKVKLLGTTSGLPTEALQTLGNEIAGYQQRLQQLITTQVQVDQGQAGITTTITSLLSIADKLTAIQKELQLTDVSGARQLLLVWLAIAIALGLIGAWLITRSIVHPLKDTVLLAQTVANGDFTRQLEVTRKDELGALSTLR